MIIFTHIAKTAGEYTAASVKQLRTKRKGFTFKGHVPSMLSDDSYKPHDKVDIVKGHVPYGYHKLFLYKKLVYITFLRDPVDRLLSSIRHSLRESRNNPVREAYSDAKKKVKPFLKLCLERQINYNIMCRQLSGKENLAKIIGIKKKKHTGAIYTPHVKSRIIYKKADMNAFYESALENITKYYTFVGFYEDLMIDIGAMCSSLRWSFKPYPKRLRRTKNMIKVDTNDEEVIALLRALNEYDIQLYDKALNHWHK